ncbi:MAG TPA: DUF1634 domain-containing protein [Cyanobacteria bacterium UBA11049]|nr:DUF1634 domain-containing protein [Cyanobacteria bacterium UBA11049]
MFNFNRQQSPHNSADKQFAFIYRWLLEPLFGLERVFAFSSNQDDLNYVNEVLSQPTSIAGDSDRLVGGEKNVTQTSSDHNIEQFISRLLKYGVLLASAVVLVGGVLYLLRHGAEPADYQFFHGAPSEFCSPLGVVKAVLSGSSRGIIQLGILLLIATPVARVVFSVLVFLWQRDFIYVSIASFVLAGLIYGLIGAYF